MNSIAELKANTKTTSKGCWEWQNAINTYGYGAFRDGSEGGKVRYAHIKAYELSAGKKAPDSWVIDHKCRNRKCVNPAHLRPTTRGENSTTNSDSPTAKNKAKVKCLNGHPLTGENVYMTPQGRRSCKICQRKRVQDFRARKGGVSKHLTGTHDQRDHARTAMVGEIPGSIARAPSGKVTQIPLRDLDHLRSQWGFRLMQHERTKRIANEILENNGLEHPVVVYRYDNGKAFIRDGQHRTEAAFKLGLPKVPVKVVHRRGQELPDKFFNSRDLKARDKLARRWTPEKATSPFKVSPLLPAVDRLNDRFSGSSQHKRLKEEKDFEARLLARKS